MTSSEKDVDYLIIGGGFYGCCLALYLRSISDRVLLVESDENLMNRASCINQARIHTGFHYPRSALTAVKSMMLHHRFMEDFPDAVIDDFQMLYAIASRHSKISAKRFYRMFRDIGAPIQPASSSQSTLFDDDLIEDVFACTETAFDYSILKTLLTAQLDKTGVSVRLSTDVVSLTEVQDSKGETIGVVAGLSDGSEVSTRYAFNITYSKINAVLDKANLPQANLKYELAELALIEPPSELTSLGVTVMDGPFFSCMPYPSEDLYSLTHVRYTPHESWTDTSRLTDHRTDFRAFKRQTRFPYMMSDGRRYLHCLGEAKYKKSIFEIKTILMKNEHDDGRPILYQQKPSNSRVISILGGKIDNIYDLFEQIKTTGMEFMDANDHLLIGVKSA